MAWFEKERPRSDKAAPAQFGHVTARERRLPSWLAKGPEAKTDTPETRHTGTSVRKTDAPAPSVRRESDRFRPVHERPASVRATSRQPSRPPSRISMSPSELESQFAERASQRASAQFLERGRTALTEAVEAIEQARRDLLYGAEPRLIELATLIARRIIARELKTQPELVADLVREGVDALAARDRLRIQLGTGFAVVSVMVSEQLAAKGIVVEMSISGEISEFGCIIETDTGRVDESIERRIDAVLEAIDTENKE